MKSTVSVEIDDVMEQEELELPVHVKNYLTAGKMANIYRSQNGVQKKMHVFLTPDMKEVICKRPNRQQVKFHWRMHIKDIEDIKVYTNHKA